MSCSVDEVIITDLPYQWEQRNLFQGSELQMENTVLSNTMLHKLSPFILGITWSNAIHGSVVVGSAIRSCMILHR